MTVHMQREIDLLKQKVLSVGARVEDALRRAVRSLVDRDATLARAVIDGDDQIDRLEVEVEEECLKILALYHPLAADLRFVVAVLKMNNDLERMGDLAANVAKRAAALVRRPDVQLPEVETMAEAALSMVKRSLDALVNADAVLARQVCADDDALDQMRKRNQQRVREMMADRPEQVEALMAASSAYRHLERVGDMATNISEDVIYMVEGEIIRHGGKG